MSKKSGKIQFILIALVFLGPLAAAAWLYLGPGDWRPAGSTNNGTLVEPVIALPEQTLAPVGDADAGDLHGKWSIAYLNRGACDETCERTLIQIRQIRLAAGKEAHRLQRVYLGTAFASSEWLNLGHAGLQLLDLSQHEAITAALEPLDSGIYLIDPLGNLMMRYPLGTEHKPIYADLKKLLKFSRIG